MNWQQTLTSAGISSATVIAVFAFLARWLFNRWTYRQEEPFKKQLEQIAFTYQTRFTRLHDKRAEIIEEFYGKLIDIDNLVKDIGTQIQPKEMNENMRSFFGTQYNLYDFYRRRRIYFSDSTDEKVLVVMNNMYALATTYRYILRIEGGQGLVDYMKEGDRIRKQTQEALEALANEFRTLLGVEIPQKK